MSDVRAVVSRAVAECLVESQFPEWAHLPVSPVDLDGNDNTTFRLGDTMLVRLPTAEGYVPQVDKEHRWLPVLAPQLPLTIPRPLGRGLPGCGYPRPWSIYRWLEGRPATLDAISDLTEFAESLAAFLNALYEIDPSAGPPAGPHSFQRGGPVSTWDRETRAVIAELSDEIDVETAVRAWEAALAARWDGRPVWVHGDVAPSNLLVRDGRLSAVIDFGCSAVGDPACDTVIAWTLFHGPSRELFQERLAVDESTWIRGKGWALWKALAVHAEARRVDPGMVEHTGVRFGWRHSARSIIEDLLTGLQ